MSKHLSEEEIHELLTNGEILDHATTPQEQFTRSRIAAMNKIPVIKELPIIGMKRIIKKSERVYLVVYEWMEADCQVGCMITLEADNYSDNQYVLHVKIVDNGNGIKYDTITPITEIPSVTLVVPLPRPGTRKIRQRYPLISKEYFHNLIMKFNKEFLDIAHTYPIPGRALVDFFLEMKPDILFLFSTIEIIR